MKSDTGAMYVLGNRLAHRRVVPGSGRPLLDALGSGRPARAGGHRVRRHARRLRHASRGDEGADRGFARYHSIAHSRQMLGFEFSSDEQEMLEGRRAPARPHDSTVRTESLYVAAHAARILDWPVRRTAPLARADGARHPARASCIVTRGAVGDLVIWDNRATMHRARPFDDTRHRREMRRVTTLISRLRPTRERFLTRAPCD